MSVLLATRYADRVEMATDGGTWNGKGELVGSKDKLVCAPSIPLAVAGVGDDADISAISRWVIGWTSGNTVDGVLEFLARTLPTRPEVSSPFRWEIVIGAVSETKGPGLWKFRNLRDDDTQLPVLTPSPRDYIFYGPPLSTDELRATGWSSTDFSSGLIEQFELMRSKVGHDWPEFVHGHKLPSGTYVGCHIDHAVVTPDGVRIERIHQWDDKIGEKIEVTA